MLISCVGWMAGLNAPLLAVLFSQFVRIKAVSSHYTRNSFTQLNKVFEDSLPENFYLAFINPIANFVKSMDQAAKKAQGKLDDGEEDECAKTMKSKPKKKESIKKTKRGELVPAASDSEEEA